MTASVDILHDIITSPFIQFFILALIAGLVKSDLFLPDQIAKALAMYLMLAIGMKGGLAIRQSDVDLSEVAMVLASGVIVGFTLPLIGFFLLRKTTALSRIDSAAVASHYGSVSVVTFSYATSFLAGKNYDYQGYIVTLMALMEAPAIISCLILARDSRQLKKSEKRHLFSRRLLQETLFNGSIVLLFGGIIIGLTGQEGRIDVVKQYLIDPFPAVLCIFLLELGLLTARKLENLKLFSKGTLLFGIYMPLIGAALGITISKILGLALPEMVLFATLCASASYIAVPAALQIALPKANPALYVTSSLAITFPFNLIIGIPLYYQVSKWAIGL